ncbi:MAG: DUF6252 family protein [Bacteroidota bacterium]|nr:DUF6252 family protein [Bacteroidota bacterium]
MRSIIVGLYVSALVATVLSNSGCSSSTSPAGDSMSAIVGAENWTAAVVEATNSNNVIAIGGLNANGTVQIRLLTYGITQAGTVQIARGQPHSAILYEDGTIYSANTMVGSGTITFSTLTSQEAEGTFSFTAVNPDKQQSRVVTNGKFRVRFK